MRTIDELLSEIDKADAEHRPNRRAELADTLLDEIREIFDGDRLQEICEAENDGRLVVLPCKVGDTVYVYNLDVCDWVMSPKVLTFVLCQSGWFVNLDMGSTDKHPDGEIWCMKLSDFGKTVFLTREEAEAKLKELESELCTRD